MKQLGESQLRQIIQEETDEVLAEIAPLLARGAAALAKTGVAQKAVGAAAKAFGKSKMGDTNLVLKLMNRMKAPEVMKKLDKANEIIPFFDELINKIPVTPQLMDRILTILRTNLKKKQAGETPPGADEPAPEEKTAAAPAAPAATAGPLPKV
jgi:hypothetical protein